MLKSADGKKFWEITQNNQQLNVRFGNTGSNGQIMIKTFSNADEAKFAKEKLTEDQLNLGFF